MFYFEKKKLISYKLYTLWYSDTTISVMILHRPGCELLDSLVRDLSYVIHLHGIEVTSPLLEMSQIDAEGGIATYIQRNIDTCTYVIVVVTESNQGLFDSLTFALFFRECKSFFKNKTTVVFLLHIANYFHYLFVYLTGTFFLNDLNMYSKLKSVRSFTYEMFEKTSNI